MELWELQQHIRTLALLGETNSPVISCYLNLGGEPTAYRHVLDERVRQMRKSLSVSVWRDFVEAMSRIRDYLRDQLSPEAKSVAIFARGGARPFFLPLEFRVPLPSHVVIGSTPNIFHLVELKDTYHRFVVLIPTEESARIIEVNLGAVTEQLWRERPELRKRVGREWSKEQYQNHRHNRAGQFIREKIELLERLMSAGGHTHLILAGNPRMTARIRKELPKHLADKLVDTVVASGRDRISDVVAATLNSFIEQEETESQAVADQLRQEVWKGGLAVIGASETFAALQRTQVDVLILASGYAPPPGWKCLSCDAVGFAERRFNDCSECGATELRLMDVREEMTRLAEQTGCQVEVVNHSDFMVEFGGVGALLRYFTPEQYQWRQRGRAAGRIT
jgi:peptide subunit release factor 1 (eRF1)